MNEHLNGLTDEATNFSFAEQEKKRTIERMKTLGRRLMLGAVIAGMAFVEGCHQKDTVAQLAENDFSHDRDLETITVTGNISEPEIREDFKPKFDRTVPEYRYRLQSLSDPDKSIEIASPTKIKLGKNPVTLTGNWFVEGYMDRNMEIHDDVFYKDAEEYLYIPEKQ